MSKTSKPFLLVLTVLALVACGRARGERTADPGVTLTAVPSSTPAPSPTPSPMPTPAAAAWLPVVGDPKDLVVQLVELPAGFERIVSEVDEAGGYTVIYFRPQALTTEDTSAASLLGVTVNLGIYEDAAAAQAQFEAQGSLDRESIAGGIAELVEDTTPIDVQPHAVQIEGTDRLLAFRARYAIETVPVVDYRYRFVVGNALANVIVTARTLGIGESADAFRDQAQAIVERQVAHLIEARGP